ncbi:MAG: integrin alpha, partial [Phycisphaerae bacterium]
MCEYDLLEGPCDDGFMCTTNDSCVDGRCIGSIIEGCGIQFSIEVAAVDGEPLPSPQSDITVFNPETLTLELYVRNWGPETLQLYNIAIDGTGYSSGPEGTLEPVREPDPTAGAFIDQSRDDYLFRDLEIIAGVFNADPAQYQYGGFVLLPEDCVEDENEPAYLGTLILEASPDASGPFSICFDDIDSNFDISPDFTFALDCVEQNIIPVDLVCANILVVADCNKNGISDSTDIADGTSEDCTGNGFPDECEADCNRNNTADSCDIANMVSEDCNQNGRPDECDIGDGISNDCNKNARPDECEPDCNANNIADACDIASGTSIDCDGMGIPDECEDCNGNGIGDICDINAGIELDCNRNLVPDQCDLISGPSTDCDINGIPDECQNTPEDCNDNGTWDRCDLYFLTEADCNQNLVPDSCDLASGFSRDCDDNLLPDECADYFDAVSMATAFDGTRGFRIQGPAPGARLGMVAHTAGDFNNDGLADLIAGAPGFTVFERNDPGSAYIVLGERGAYPGDIYLNNRAISMIGSESGDSLGNGVSGGGDFNGDGIDDIIVGTPGVDELVEDESIPNIGGAHVVFGSDTYRGGDDIITEMLDGANGFTIRGAAERTFTGRRVEFVGDVNQDGLDDVLISAHTSDDGDNDSAGRTYLLFGQMSIATSQFDLAQLEPTNGGDGTLGCYFAGISAFDQSGFSISAAGDVNQDGIDDLLIGAYPADPDGMNFAGETYLIFGRPDICETGRVELASLNGTNGVMLTGRNAADLSGHHVADVGDLNNDGIDDFAVSAIWADPAGTSEGGEVYVVWGRPNPWPAVIPLESLSPASGGGGSTGVIVQGIGNGHLSGFGLGGGGDIDTDGIDDLLIGAYAADEIDAENAGRMYALFGHDGDWPPVISLSEVMQMDVAPDERSGFAILGDYTNAFFGYVVGPIGDMNGDGAVTFADVDPYVLALSDMPAYISTHLSAYPDM